MSSNYFRDFTKDWGNEVYPTLQTKNQISNFCDLCKEIYNNLYYINKYDKTDFNNISGLSIDSLIKVFDNMYKNFYNLVCILPYDKKQKEVLGNNYSDTNFWESSKRFDIGIGDLNQDKFNIERKPTKINSDNFTTTVVSGIKDEYYSEIKSAVNKLLIFERVLKFVTMKDIFWKGVAKSGSQIDLSKDFCICGKLLFEGGWRISSNNDDVNDFGKKKIYQSASIISSKDLNKLFIPNDSVCSFKRKVFLVYKFDLSKITCVSCGDAFSDELINGNTNFKEMTMHTNIQKIDETFKDGNVHELFAYSSVFSTLNCLLNANTIYNEVVLKDPEPIGVIAIDKYSEDYAYFVSKQLNIKYLGVMPQNKKTNNYFNSF